MELKFAVDTKHRNDWFTGMSFSHPAKMSLPLQLWLIENYTKEGDVILDPMAGSGTILVACSMGRNVICVELEAKFIDIIKGNWAKIQQRGPQMGYTMGTATILQGDARNLEGILADKCIFSPPYADHTAKIDGSTKFWQERERRWGSRVASPRRREIDNQDYGESEGQIGNLRYGEIDKIITSPPYEGIEIVPGAQTVRSEG